MLVEIRSKKLVRKKLSKDVYCEEHSYVCIYETDYIRIHADGTYELLIKSTGKLIKGDAEEHEVYVNGDRRI